MFAADFARAWTEAHHGLFLWVNLGNEASPVLLACARFASLTWPALLLAMVLGLAVAGPRPWQRMAFCMLLSMALAWLAARAIQWVFPLPRPFALHIGRAWLTHAASPGFPSTHASVALALGATGAWMAPVRWARVGWPLLTLPVAWSRVALGLHFPGDVMGAALVALLVSWGVAQGADLMNRSPWRVSTIGPVR